jgi:hypothetical protein
VFIKKSGVFGAKNTGGKTLISDLGPTLNVEPLFKVAPFLFIPRETDYLNVPQVRRPNLLSTDIVQQTLVALEL